MELIRDSKISVFAILWLDFKHSVSTIVAFVLDGSSQTLVCALALS